MGRKKKKQQKQSQENSSTAAENQPDSSKSVGDCTTGENWDEFLNEIGSDDSSESYAEWPQLESLLTEQLSSPSLLPPETAGEAPPAVLAAEMAILVPKCGKSELSEHLYDAGFTNITNLDFSKVAIAHMLRRNLSERPMMKWRVMDITRIQYEDKTIDAIIDNGGLDALMVPELGSGLGRRYLSEVKRLLKPGGKYICLTKAESRVSDILFSMFRFGWKMSLHTISKELQTFMVVIEKDICASVHEISVMDEYSVESHGNQVCELYNALERERKFRSEYCSGCDVLYSLKDLKLGAKGNLKELEEGRRINLILGEPEGSQFYKGVLIDAQQNSDPFLYHIAVLPVPHIRVDDWIFSSEEGQKNLIANSKASRLLIKYLTPLVRQLAPRECDDSDTFPFMHINDGTYQREVVHQVTSALAGTIVVDEAIYLDLDQYDEDLDLVSDYRDLIFRRLTFERSANMVQSEALLAGQIEGKKVKKGKQRSYCRPSRSYGEGKVDHNYLVRPYHNVIISGLMLISLHLKGSSSTECMFETVVIGIGAGLLPMFMKNWMPNLNIEVVELDQVVLDVAKEHFGFKEDEKLRVCITDGIQFVRDKADSGAVTEGLHCTVVHAEGESSSKLDILIVDKDAPNLSSALICPAADFVEESFLQNAKNSLSEEGLFIIRLASRSPAATTAVYSTLKKVFGKSLLYLKLDDDVNEVIFALKNESPITEEDLSKACDELERSLELVTRKWGKRVIKASKLIQPLR
ncbi:hypothetical protein MIMGU_mgv1a024178mg [Erythranthe guttata]|uniref:Methyltransferase type 11 domain-containing protein n=1 Tax=Erythranthe guttata TaxID=4155 RepID=A0A022PTA5_ERYGU|nr:hypothetical protein MIMGU_mgv1a024178mg [Erythranthe guttata]